MTPKPGRCRPPLSGCAGCWPKPAARRAEPPILRHRIPRAMPARHRRTRFFSRYAAGQPCLARVRGRKPLLEENLTGLGARPWVNCRKALLRLGMREVGTTGCDRGNYLRICWWTTNPVHRFDWATGSYPHTDASASRFGRPDWLSGATKWWC
uniref:Uncharacterized protein n=1 Tax=Ralstonia syzygii R24 TaxID=907261 RepID=G3ACC1_9RALS|nr:hypothetical protein RALSY_mp30529 [Ralstonia syzygii R24]